jgi:endonuclease YncB( thermonuclease family)
MNKNKRRPLLTVVFLSLVCGMGIYSAMAAKVFSGKVTEVRSADLIVVNYGPGQYVVRLAGINPGAEGTIAEDAKKFVTDAVLGKVVRAKFDSRDANDEMISQVYVGEPGEDVGLELVRAGLAQRQEGPDPQFGYKYDELSKAENEAREAKRGLWAPAASK